MTFLTRQSQEEVHFHVLYVPPSALKELNSIIDYYYYTGLYTAPEICPALYIDKPYFSFSYPHLTSTSVMLDQF